MKDLNDDYTRDHQPITLDMKTYFGFTLDSKQFLPVWLVFLIVVIAPYVFAVRSMGVTEPGDLPPAWVWIVFPVFILGYLFMTYYMVRITINNLHLGDVTLNFHGGFAAFVSKVIIGFLLSIITLGIYIPWFIRNLIRFFLGNTTYKENNFTFLGEASRLLIIVIIAGIIPMIVLVSVINILFGINPGISGTFVQQLLSTVIMVPLMYFVYKWYFDVRYKDYHIAWETDMVHSWLTILGQVLLVFITVGIYFPVAYLRLYKYFIGQTYARDGSNDKRFGYDLEPIRDFLVIWGQLLLCIITLGVYFPWAYTRVMKHVLSKTYIVPLETVD